MPTCAESATRRHADPDAMTAPLAQKAASQRPRQTACESSRFLTGRPRQAGSPGGAVMAPNVEVTGLSPKE